MKNKKDAIFLCQFFFPEYISSALLPFQTALKLRESGMSVDVLCGYPKEYKAKNHKPRKKEVIEGLTINRLGYLQLSRKGFVSRLTNYLSFTTSALFRLSTFRNYKTIIVYSNPPILPLVAVFAKKLFNCKIIFVSYDVYPEIAIQTNVLKKNSLITRIMHTVNNCVFKNASSVVALSQDMKEFLIENRKIESKKVIVIPNWATEEEVTQGKVLEHLKKLQEESELIISYFGNIARNTHDETR